MGRMKHYPTWMQLSSNEQLWLAIAEACLYASLLSFFMAFFNWFLHHTTRPDNLVDKKESVAVMSNDHVQLPMFKPHQSHEHKEGSPFLAANSKQSTHKKN